MRSTEVKLMQLLCGSTSSPIRQKNVDRLLAKHAGVITVNRLKQILSDHTNYPLSICRHVSSKDPLCTTAAVVADLTDQEIHIAMGNPCVARFRKYSFATKWPKT